MALNIGLPAFCTTQSKNNTTINMYTRKPRVATLSWAQKLVLASQERKNSVCRSNLLLNPLPLHPGWVSFLQACILLLRDGLYANQTYDTSQPQNILATLSKCLSCLYLGAFPEDNALHYSTHGVITLTGTPIRSLGEPLPRPPCWLSPQQYPSPSVVTPHVAMPPGLIAAQV
jgi:hypothetical protein